MTYVLRDGVWNPVIAFERIVASRSAYNGVLQITRPVILEMPSAIEVTPPAARANVTSLKPNAWETVSMNAYIKTTWVIRHRGYWFSRTETGFHSRARMACST